MLSLVACLAVCPQIPPQVRLAVLAEMTRTSAVLGPVTTNVWITSNSKPTLEHPTLPPQ